MFNASLGAFKALEPNAIVDSVREAAILEKCRPKEVRKFYEGLPTRKRS